MSAPSLTQTQAPMLVERPRHAYISFYARLVHHLVNMVRRRARLGFPGGNVEHLPRQPAHLAHAILLRLIEDGDLVAADKALLGARYAVLGVLWVRYPFRNRAACRERVDGS